MSQCQILLDIAQIEELVGNFCVVVGSDEGLSALAIGVHRHGKSCVGIAGPADSGLVVDDVGQRDRDRVVAAVEQ